MFDRINYHLLATIMLLGGCAQTASIPDSGEKPDWLTGEPVNYPNINYVYATGSASNAEAARDRALGNLAKIFELQIRESSTTTQDVQTRKVKGEEDVESSARIAHTVNVHTDKMIKGARIAEQWQNPDDLTHYALAVLDRTQAGNNIRGEMNRLDREIAFSVAAADGHQDLLQKVADLQDAISMQSRRDSLQKTLKIIDLDGRGNPSAWSVSELSEQQQQALKSMNIRAAVVADSVGELEEVLQGAMASAGFEHTSDGAGYILSASVETQDAIQKEGWYWQRGTLRLRLVNAGGTVLGNQSWPLKVSAIQRSELNQRMLAEIDNRLKSDLKDTVLGFAGGQQESQ